ncbi:Transducin family protein / WD-40 repeat family protein [Hibiscus syriacus]|uniref:Transducin family protein / WD-40 repeat family protein n=1 Tax=Hibiscus syriacus TaxID=106335 RepID=A0A6A2XB42_HIBSY|nr:Transducin family protein / WD-40 repeat family protein [Hibiscus syriacus]
MKILFATLLVGSLLLSCSVLEAAMAQPRSPSCEGKCRARCIKAAVWDRCFKTVGYAARSATVFHLGLMGTNTSALAIGTSSTTRASPSALENLKKNQTFFVSSISRSLFACLHHETCACVHGCKRK